MRVKWEGREIWIEFSYSFEHYRPDCPHDRDVVEEHSKCLREITICILRDGLAQRGEREPAPVVAEGGVIRYYLDPPDRDKARKAALSAALANLDKVLPVPREQAYAAVKERRRLFWTAYLNRKVVTGKAGA